MTLLTERLQRWAEERGDNLAFAFMPDGVTPRDTLTFAGLDRAARGIAGALRGVGARGRPVMLLCEPGPDFVTALAGCLYAGAVAVPVPATVRARGLERIRAVAKDAHPAAVLATGERFVACSDDFSRVPWLRVDEVAAGEPCAITPGGRNDPVLIQYTSGSTASPKGVVLTQANLVANIGMLHDGFDAHAGSRYLSWLPLFHDMGLIAHLLAALHSGVPSWFAPPMSFFRRPESWLHAISRHRISMSGAPNFAYEMCVRRYPRMALDGLSLESWEAAFCGAETVRASTMERFAALFEPHGLRPSALRPCYGLAEATVFVSAARSVRILPGALSPTTSTLISCGSTQPGGSVAIVDPDTLAHRRDGEVGEIYVGGPHVAAGYWGRPKESEATFAVRLPDQAEHCPMLRTGDLGLLWEGELYITGRLKDVLLVRGETIHAEDVEQIVNAAHPDLVGLNSAFALDIDGEEGLVVIQEMPRGGSQPDAVELVGAAMRAVADAFGIRLHDCVLVRSGAIPRTTSGKVQRARCRELYVAGEMSGLAGSDGHPSLGRSQSIR